VHLGGGMPRGYDDSTLDAIRRSGGTATDDVDAGLARLSPLNFVDGRRVDVSSGCGVSRAALPVVARQAILLADRGGIAPLAGLDRLHKIAVDAGVITPYSSMLVLLTPGQLARLRQLTNDGSRFDREVTQLAAPETAKAEHAAKDNGRANNAPPPPTAAPSPRLKEALDVIGPRPTSEPEVQMRALATRQRENDVAARRADPPAGSGANTLFGVTSHSVAGSVDERKAVASSVAADDGADGVPVATETATDDVAVAVPAESAEAPTAAPPAAVPQVSGVPEPHEWLLVVLAAIAVVVMVRRRTA